ncbi:MAG: low molecular weight protein-tyrosine-phosphatase [Pseudomonadota bacterium]
MTKSILCVCLGNICRSPTAEAVLSARLPGIRVDSAGTGDWHIGAPPYGPAQKAAAQRGYDLSQQRARQVTRQDFYDFQMIFAMDAQNLADLHAIAPKDSTARRLLFLEPLGGGDVPDPYYTGDFEHTLDLIEAAAEAWARQPHISSAI